MCGNSGQSQPGKVLVKNAFHGFGLLRYDDQGTFVIPIPQHRAVPRHPVFKVPANPPLLILTCGQAFLLSVGRQNGQHLYLSGFGLLFGRLGDAAGTAGCILMAGHTVVLVSLAAVLFAAAILAFFILYQRVYLPAPVREKTEQERFDSFVVKYDLSSREREVLQLILAGQSNPEIAGNLYVSDTDS